MISAKEAYNISFVNDECKEYLDEIERKILEEAKADNYNVSIKLATRGLDISEDESHKITIAIIGYCYFCNSCHNSFWESLDGSIEDSSDVMILGADMSPKTCDYEISIDLVSFGVDTATRNGKKIANDIADYLGNAGYNVSISSGDRRASLTIDLSNAKYLKED